MPPRPHRLILITDDQVTTHSLNENEIGLVRRLLAGMQNPPTANTRRSGLLTEVSLVSLEPADKPARRGRKPGRKPGRPAASAIAGEAAEVAPAEAAPPAAPAPVEPLPEPPVLTLDPVDAAPPAAGEAGALG